METRKFQHQLGTAIIRINPDGTAMFRRKEYSSYKNARRSLTNYYGFAWEIK